MTKHTLVILLTVFSVTAFGQPNPTEQAQPIVAEGKYLYSLEMAAWHGTDLFLEQYKNHDNVGGYVTYVNHNQPTCVFFSRGNKLRAIGTIEFDSTFNLKNATVNLTERDVTPLETDLFTLRNLTYQIAKKDTIFKHYQNTSYNIIPVIKDGVRKVYILTGTSQNNVVMLGNDYELVFDKNNNLTYRKHLHNNIIPLEYGNDDGKDIIGAIHNHNAETGDFITATDICTLMLYSRLANWKVHHVVSKKYLNIWNCITKELTVVPIENVEKKE